MLSDAIWPVVEARNQRKLGLRSGRETARSRPVRRARRRPRPARRSSAEQRLLDPDPTRESRNLDARVALVHTPPADRLPVEGAPPRQRIDLGSPADGWRAAVRIDARARRAFVGDRELDLSILLFDLLAYLLTCRSELQRASAAALALRVSGHQPQLRTDGGLPAAARAPRRWGSGSRRGVARPRLRGARGAGERNDVAPDGAATSVAVRLVRREGFEPSTLRSEERWSAGFCLFCVYPTKFGTNTCSN